MAAQEETIEIGERPVVAQSRHNGKSLRYVSNSF